MSWKKNLVELFDVGLPLVVVGGRLQLLDHYRKWIGAAELLSSHLIGIEHLLINVTVAAMSNGQTEKNTSYSTFSS